MMRQVMSAILTLCDYNVVFQLEFKKGDKITVTQKEEGGWWEGTLGDKTGWFPSNYVKEIKGNLMNALQQWSET